MDNHDASSNPPATHAVDCTCASILAMAASSFFAWCNSHVTVCNGS